MNAPENGPMSILKNLSINHVRGPHGGGVEEWGVGGGERRGEGEGKGREGGALGKRTRMAVQTTK